MFTAQAGPILQNRIWVLSREESAGAEPQARRVRVFAPPDAGPTYRIVPSQILTVARFGVLDPNTYLDLGGRESPPHAAIRATSHLNHLNPGSRGHILPET